jgi:hypothetical protein
MNREIEQASTRIGLLKLKMSGDGYAKAPEAVRASQAEKVFARSEPSVMRSRFLTC